MGLVIDSSVASAWALPDEESELAVVALRRLETDMAVVPALFWLEVRNTVIVSERRGRLDVAATTRFLTRRGAFSVLVDAEPVENAVLDLARRHGLTVYDAAYLELAQRRGLPLATLDRRLAAAALAAGVTRLAD
jgi:predicted nucleic acid-binding protein